MSGITPKYELKIIINPPMSGKVNGAGKYAEGKEVQVDVTAFTGWKFLGWSGDISHSKTSFSIIVDKNITITAQFKKVAKLIDKSTFLSGFILFLSIVNIVFLYKIVEKIQLNEERTGSTIVSQSESLDQKIESLKESQTKLDQKIEALASGQSSINEKINNSVYDQKAATEKLNGLARKNVDYKVWTGEITAANSITNTNEIHSMYIGASKSLYVYLSGMSDDADFAVFDPSGKQISSSTRSTPIPDDVDFTTSSAGTYTFKVYNPFKVYNQPTKYKLEVYVRN